MSMLPYIDLLTSTRLLSGVHGPGPGNEVKEVTGIGMIESRLSRVAGRRVDDLVSDSSRLSFWILTGDNARYRGGKERYR